MAERFVIRDEMIVAYPMPVRNEILPNIKKANEKSNVERSKKSPGGGNTN